MHGIVSGLNSFRDRLTCGPVRSCKRIASSALSFRLAGALAVALGCASAASAADRGSAEDAQAMLARAAARYQEVGKTQALEEFTSDKARFNDRDLYIYCMNLSDSHWTAHGVNKVLVGRDLASVKDADGQSIGDAILVAVRDKPSATIRYKWPDPVTRKVLPKLTFLQKMGDQVCGVGVYEGQSQP